MKNSCAVKGSQHKSKITYKNQNKPQTEQLVMTFATSVMGGHNSLTDVAIVISVFV